MSSIESPAFCVGASAESLPKWLVERLGEDVHFSKEPPHLVVDGPNGQTPFDVGDIIVLVPNGTLCKVQRDADGELMEAMLTASRPRPS